MDDELFFEDVQPDPLTFSAPELTPLEFLTDISSQKLYLSWLQAGYEGTEADFLEWLRGGNGGECSVGDVYLIFENALI